MEYRTKPTKVFIRDNNGEYIEISFDVFNQRRAADKSYQAKRFIYLYGMLQEVSDAEYHDFYKCRRRRRYIKELDAKFKLRSVENIGEDRIAAQEPNVEEIVIEHCDAACLRQSVSRLEADERDLIDALFYRNMTAREYAAQYGVPVGSVSRHKKRALYHLKEYLQSI